MEKNLHFLTIVTDRNQDIMLPIFHSFEKQTGIKIKNIYIYNCYENIRYNTRKKIKIQQILL
ncbi:hypothetical protein LSO9J_20103 [Candidatus Liberibacter solanacearum]